MHPTGKARLYPAGPMLLNYVCQDYPVDVGWPWSKEESVAATKRGLHISALELDTIKMVEEETAEKIKHGFAVVVYLDDIIDKLSTTDW